MFGRHLCHNIENRFPRCGSGVAEYCLGNYFDPRAKGVHLKALQKMTDRKLFPFCQKLPNMSLGYLLPRPRVSGYLVQQGSLSPLPEIPISEPSTSQ